MGHCSQIALGVAMQKTKQKVYCIDGDGAALMHLGSLGLIGSQKPENFIHILINNGAHDSVGGQPTIGFDIDFCNIARSMNYKSILKAHNREELVNNIQSDDLNEGPVFFEIMTTKGARKDLGRPTLSALDNKKDFMSFMNVK